MEEDEWQLCLPGGGEISTGSLYSYTVVFGAAYDRGQTPLRQHNAVERAGRAGSTRAAGTTPI